MVPWWILSNQLPATMTESPNLKTRPMALSAWNWVPGARMYLEFPGHQVTSLEGQNPSRKMTASWQMRMEKFLHLPVWTLIKSYLSSCIYSVYIYICVSIYIYKAFMYGKLKENSDTNFWFVLICVLPSSLLYGVPPHQIPLKPPNLQLFTPHLHFFQCQGPIQCFQGTLPRSYIVKNHGFQHYAVKW